MYVESFTNYKRFETKKVYVGDLVVGAEAPVRVQTMTNTDTNSVETTVEQVEAAIRNGAELVRITVPTMASLKALTEISETIKSRKNSVPLVADVHFNPQIAAKSAEILQKVRINPGNFVKSKNSIYTDSEYKAELNKVATILKPFFEKCKNNNTAVRIGTNHGSLSQRIINKYGNTVKGLVQATIEYLNICKENNFENIVVSIKSSNPTVMVQANRFLVDEMKRKNMNFPIHLGVTEAGNRRDGRIKSALGIGALLADGIGDTIRVSLTERPENEIPVALKIVEHVAKRQSADKIDEIDKFQNPYSFQRRETFLVKNIGGTKPPVVVANYLNKNKNFGEFAPDFLLLNDNEIPKNPKTDTKYIIPSKNWTNQPDTIPLFSSNEIKNIDPNLPIAFVSLNYLELSENNLKLLANLQNTVILANNVTNNKIGEYRLFFSILSKAKCKNPVILQFECNTPNVEDFYIQTAIDTSVFLIDGLADGLLITNDKINNLAEIVDTSFDILQAAHRRLSKTEFISCPSCGRTLFDLEEVTERVKIRTGHLKGLKIAVMGCIVNGPGEVADADYGYVGAGSNKVTLFKGKKPVKKNINETDAVEELINLIKENGDWIEK